MQQRLIRYQTRFLVSGLLKESISLTTNLTSSSDYILRISQIDDTFFHALVIEVIELLFFDPIKMKTQTCIYLDPTQAVHSGSHQ